MEPLELLFKGSTNLQVLNTVLNVAVIPLIGTLWALRSEIGKTKDAINALHLLLVDKYVSKEDLREDLKDIKNVLNFRNRRT